MNKKLTAILLIAVIALTGCGKSAPTAKLDLENGCKAYRKLDQNMTLYWFSEASKKDPRYLQTLEKAQIAFTKKYSVYGNKSIIKSIDFLNSLCGWPEFK